MATSFEDLVRERAYALWQKAGSPPSREHDFWFLAEQEIITELTIKRLHARDGGKEDAEPPAKERDEN